MTKEEAKMVDSFINGVYSRVNGAKKAISEMNFGLAMDILSAPFPIIKISVNDKE